MSDNNQLPNEARLINKLFFYTQVVVHLLAGSAAKTIDFVRWLQRIVLRNIFLDRFQKIERFSFVYHFYSVNKLREYLLQYMGN